jgi:hypothetical protein
MMESGRIGMIKTEILEKIIKATLFSAYIADERPVSLLISADVESGKTSLVVKFKDNQYIKYLTDATAFSIWRDLAGNIEAGEIKHFIFPDILTSFSKGQDTVNSFIMFLTNMIEEGLSEIHSGFLPDGGITIKSPTTVGIIACIARGELNDNRHKWARAGFMSRMLPVSYIYSKDSINEIKESISERAYSKDVDIKLKLPSSPVRMTLPTDIAVEVRKIEEQLSLKVAYSTYGFRTLKAMQRLLMGYTLSQHRIKVEWKDFDVLKNEMMQFINLDYTEI